MNSLGGISEQVESSILLVINKTLRNEEFNIEEFQSNMRGYVQDFNKNYTYKKLFSDKQSVILKNMVLARKPEVK